MKCQALTIAHYNRRGAYVRLGQPCHHPVYAEHEGTTLCFSHYYRAAGLRATPGTNRKTLNLDALTSDHDERARPCLCRFCVRWLILDGNAAVAR